MTIESSAVAEAPRSTLAYESLQQAFPEVPSGLRRAFGSRVLVQLRTPMTRTKSGLYVPEQSRETEQWNTQVAKVIDIGPAAFRDRDTLEPWPEGIWAEPGMFVRCPKYGGDRWQVRIPGSPDSAIFVLFRDLDLGGEVAEEDVLDFVAYLD